LEEYGVELQYFQGEKNIVADSLPPSDGRTIIFEEETA
jgi:hypothetical protein